MVYSRFKFLIEEFTLEAAEKLVVHGQVDGFYTLVSVQPQTNRYYLMIGAHPGEMAASIVDLFKKTKELPTILAIRQEAATIVITGKVTLRKKKMLQAIRHILTHFPTALRDLGYETGDFKTGINDGTVKLTQFNQYYTYLSDENYQLTLEEVKQQQQIYAEQKENMLLGFVGAFLGASVGGLLWFGIGLLGYFAWIAGVLGFFLAFKGYQVFGAKVSAIGAVLVFLVTIFLVFFANHALWTWMANDGYDAYFWQTFASIHRLIFAQATLRMNYLMDLLFGVGMIALIGLPFMRSLYKESASQYQVKR